MKKLITFIIFMLFVFPVTSLGNADVKNDNDFQNTKYTPPWIKQFNIEIFININYGNLNTTPLRIDQTYNIPVEISASTDIPNNFMWWNPFWQIRNLFLFGSFIGPNMKVYLFAQDQIGNINMTFAQPTLIMDIPFGDDIVSQDTSLILTPNRYATALPHDITITANCSRIGRINGDYTEFTFSATPAWFDCIQINVNDPIQTLKSGENANVNISLNNCGNGDIIVVGEIYDNDIEYMKVDLNKSVLFIDRNETKNCTFSIETHDVDGFINYYKQIEIVFTPYYPPTEEIGNPVRVYVVVNIYNG